MVQKLTPPPFAKKNGGWGTGPEWVSEAFRTGGALAQNVGCKRLRGHWKLGPASQRHPNPPTAQSKTPGARARLGTRQGKAPEYLSCGKEAGEPWEEFQRSGHRALPESQLDIGEGMTQGH